MAMPVARPWSSAIPTVFSPDSNIPGSPLKKSRNPVPKLFAPATMLDQIPAKNPVIAPQLEMMIPSGWNFRKISFRNPKKAVAPDLMFPHRFPKNADTVSQFLTRSTTMPIRAATPAMMRPTGFAVMAAFKSHCPAAAAFWATPRAMALTLYCPVAKARACVAMADRVRDNALAFSAAVPDTVAMVFRAVAAVCWFSNRIAVSRRILFKVTTGVIASWAACMAKVPEARAMLATFHATNPVTISGMNLMMVSTWSARNERAPVRRVSPKAASWPAAPAMCGSWAPNSRKAGIRAPSEVPMLPSEPPRVVPEALREVVKAFHELKSSCPNAVRMESATERTRAPKATKPSSWPSNCSRVPASMVRPAQNRLNPERTPSVMARTRAPKATSPSSCPLNSSRVAASMVSPDHSACSPSRRSNRKPTSRESSSTLKARAKAPVKSPSTKMDFRPEIPSITRLKPASAVVEKFWIFGPA